MKRSIAKVITLLAASAGGAACVFFIQVLVARHLEPSLYGIFASTLAMVTLIASMASLGVPGFIIRVFGAEGREASRWLKTSFRLVGYGVIACSFLLLVWGGTGPHEKQTFILLALFLPLVVSQAFTELVTVKLQLEERFYALALWQLLPNLMRLLVLAAVLVLFHPYTSITGLGAVYSITAVTIAIMSLFLMQNFSEKTGDFHSHSTSQSVFVEGSTSPSTIIRYSLPFALSGVFYIIYFQSDVILLNYLSGSEAAGFYNVAFTVMVAIYLLPNIIYQKFLLPKLYRWVHYDQQQLFRVYRKGSVLMGITGVALMALMFVLVPVIISRLFGEAYHETISILNILLLCIPIRFISSSIASVLVSENNIKRKVTVMGYTALANVVLNLMLIPTWGVYGAAVATLLSELLLLGFFYRTLQKHMFQVTNKVSV